MRVLGKSGLVERKIAVDSVLARLIGITGTVVKMMAIIAASDTASYIHVSSVLVLKQKYVNLMQILVILF